jgi:hypothetical protein
MSVDPMMHWHMYVNWDQKLYICYQNVHKCVVTFHTSTVYFNLCWTNQILRAWTIDQMAISWHYWFLLTVLCYYTHKIEFFVYTICIHRVVLFYYTICIHRFQCYFSKARICSFSRNWKQVQSMSMFFIGHL